MGGGKGGGGLQNGRGGELQNRRGGTCEVLPLRKGRSFSHAEEGAQTVLGYFFM